MAADQIGPGLESDHVALAGFDRRDEQDKAPGFELPPIERAIRQLVHPGLAEIGVERNHRDVAGVEVMTQRRGDGQEIAPGRLRIDQEMIGMVEHAEHPADEVLGQPAGAVLRRHDRNHVVDEGNIADAARRLGVPDVQEVILQPPAGAEIDERRPIREIEPVGQREEQPQASDGINPFGREAIAVGGAELCDRAHPLDRQFQPVVPAIDETAEPYLALTRARQRAFDRLDLHALDAGRQPRIGIIADEVGYVEDERWQRTVRAVGRGRSGHFVGDHVADMAEQRGFARPRRQRFELRAQLRDQRRPPAMRALGKQAQQLVALARRGFSGMQRLQEMRYGLIVAAQLFV